MSTERFPYPEEVQLPAELEGWERMYPPIRLFSPDRQAWERAHFWYQDKIHAPDPMYPLDDLFHEAWQIALSQYTTRVFCIPPAQGVAQRILGCYMYITPVAGPSEATQQAKAERFNRRVPFVFEHYDRLWDQWLRKFQEVGRQLAQVKVPPELRAFVPDEEVFPAPRGYTEAYELLEAYNRCIDLIFRGWQYHFEYLNLAYLAYLMFADTTRKLFPGITDSTIGRMVAGAEVFMFRPEEELCRLARLAAASPSVAEILKQDLPAGAKIEQLKGFEAGRAWLDELERAKDPWFYVSTGSGWYHYEGSWITNLDIPFGYLRSYVERLERGERIERSLEEIHAAREQLVKEYRALIATEPDRKSFEDAYQTVRTIYRYAEDHLFWVEHWLHTIWFAKMREFGQLLTRTGLLADPDDLFLFNRFEIPVLLEDVATAWALGEGVPHRGTYWQQEAGSRRRILEAAAAWVPVPALGVPPAEVVEPFTVMLWGITTEKVQEWLKGVAVEPAEVKELKGFAASAGVAEGPARVVKLLEEIHTVQPGEILVVPCTNPAWAPVFTKIRATVTDIGGITSHAAIVSREYGLPAVTGTGMATSVVRTGDLIRVDGEKGVVQILQRAAVPA